MISFEQVLLRIPTPITNFCDQLYSHGIKLTAVGGIVRDLFLERTPLIDWDFEMRSVTGVEQDFDQLLTQIFSTKIQSLGFGVYRLSLDEDFQIELSVPRVESYSTKLNAIKTHPLGHRDVEVKLKQNCDFRTAFLRRDLTINALGLDYVNKEWQLIDPFGGLQDLENKVARVCSEEFSYDPVRFLRAIRFRLLFNLEYANETLMAFEKMNLEKATDHYLLYEALKAGFFPFFREFFKLVQTHQVTIPESWHEIDFLQHNQLSTTFVNVDEILLLATFLGSKQWGLSELGKLERFLKLRRGRAKHFVTAQNLLERMASFDWSEQVKTLSALDWSDVKQSETVLFALELHKHWNTWTGVEELRLKHLLPDEAKLLASWRQYFPRELLGKTKFDRDQRVNDVVPTERAVFRLWCHLTEIVGQVQK